MLLGWIVAFSVMGSIASVAGAAVVLLFPENTRKVLLPCLVSYATGTLLGAAFLGMIPEALQGATPTVTSGTVLAGIVLFFVLEKAVIWRHCHDDACEVHGTAGPLLLIGDAFHNFVDGFVIAAAFLTSIPFGIAASLAVIAHEIPQEVGDFAILLESGYSRLKALVLNTLSSMATLPGAVIAYFFLGQTREAIPYILALSAASFIYIATADLVPSLHRKAGVKSGLLQLILLLVGIGTIGLFKFAH